MERTHLILKDETKARYLGSRIAVHRREYLVILYPRIPDLEAVGIHQTPPLPFSPSTIVKNS